MLAKPYIVSAICAAVFATASFALIDENDNGLSDIWEQRFDAGSLSLNDDDDGDSFSNLEECIAGTDPFDSSDRPLLVPTYLEDTDGLRVSFQTFSGKSYQVLHSADLSAFEAISRDAWPGDGAVRELILNKQGQSETLSFIKTEFWANIAADTIEDLTLLESYPLSPDGITYQSEPEALNFKATGYGARMRFSITPPESGSYTFFLSSGGPAELYGSEYATGENSVKVAEVLEAQAGLQSGEWDTFATQRSYPYDLFAGKRYYFELLYVGKVPSQHVELAWSGPGLDGVERVTRDHLVQEAFNPKVALFAHDYDSPGELGSLWPNNSAIQSGVIGMNGNAERITGDPGSNSDERISLDKDTSTHLYATWLFNMAYTGEDPVSHDDVSVVFMNDSNYNQEGPRISMEERTVSGERIATIRAGGANANEVQINLAYGQTYRVEIVSTLDPNGFTYMTPSGEANVAANTFDLYVSDTAGQLIGSPALGLNFRDVAEDEDVEKFSTLQLSFATNPNIALDDWEVTDGDIVGNGYLPSGLADFSQMPNFFKLEIEEQDQDGDGLADWEELALAAYYEILFFDSETTDGVPDTSVLEPILALAQGKPDVMLYGTDASAFESNYPNTTEDRGEFTITREGLLEPLDVQICFPPLVASGTFETVCNGMCCMLIGSAGDEEAEPEDFILTDEDGSVITDTVHFEFGETTKVITLTAVQDSINEYPETVNIAIKASEDDSYEISTLMNGASIQLFDLPESPDNITLFTGELSREITSGETSGSGGVVATINGPRTEMRIWNDFSGLTTPQTNSHVHKAVVGELGNMPGPVVYPITVTPGDANALPFNGLLEYYPEVVLSGDPVPEDVTKGSGYPWDLTEASPVVSSVSGETASKQVIIDSLFQQNGETPLYLNIHTTENMAGELWAFLDVSGGSVEDPGDAPAAPAPGTSEYPQITEDFLLEVEIRRFLNQATFGATDQSVQALLDTIQNARSSDPDYHRFTAFEEWIDTQMDESLTPQTYLLDYTVASFFQQFTLAGIFDPTLYKKDDGTIDETVDVPDQLEEWPSINRSEANPEHWYLSSSFPFNYVELEQADDGGLGIGRGFRDFETGAHWNMMINAKDQLRQKMGYALQQIVVVSLEDDRIENNLYGAANYQDMINVHAFSYYRDILGFVNWSPIMGSWLSSLRNQKAVDFDGDGLFDSYPDENLARENMQLFSIGLFDIWSDGTLKLSAEGLPRQTYTNEDIKEFARILTGQSLGSYERTWVVPTWGGSDSFLPNNDEFNVSIGDTGHLSRSYLYPMKMFGEYHSLGAKSFAGVTIDNSDISDLKLQAEADIEDAIDWLAGKPGDGLDDFDMVNSHVSTPAFISRRLIQRFTTSNPSKEYLHRVSTVFKNSEGDLGLTLKAILLDPEVRKIDLEDTTFGMKKSPLEGYVQMLRALDAHTHIPLYDPEGAAPYDTAAGDFSNPDLYLENFSYPAEQLANFERNTRLMMRSAYGTGTATSGLQMSPFSQLTVFNFYLPDFKPGGIIGNAGLYAPEFQLANEPDLVRNINYFEDITRSSLGPSGEELGVTDSNQELAFNSEDATLNDYLRLDRQALADAFYPAVEPDTEVTFEADGLTDTQTVASGSLAPVWLKLVRAGDVFTSSQSIDGITWTEERTWTMTLPNELYIGLAVTSHDDGSSPTLTTAVFDNLNVVGGSGDWNGRDIGGVALAGSLTQNVNGEYEIQAAGDDIWGSYDEFYFVYQILNGDGEITVEVKSLVNTNVWAKAGVMMRETLEPNSANVMTLVSAANGVRSQSRAQSIGRSSESFADEALLDELDMRLTNGYFKMRYPYDTSDNDDPLSPGADGLLKNPRELIIDAITAAYGDPYDGNNDESDRLNKLSDALYLLTFSPEFQIKK